MILNTITLYNFLLYCEWYNKLEVEHAWRDSKRLVGNPQIKKFNKIKIKIQIDDIHIVKTRNEKVSQRLYTNQI